MNVALANVADTVSPPLKWAGGKRWQVPHLVEHWRKHSTARLVEPFCGGMAVTLGLMPQLAVLNDVNPHLINFYQWVQRGLSIDFEMANDEGVYYAARARFNGLVAAGQGATAEAAGLFYYLNRTGYNGLCRFNSKGGFNVPFGSYKTITYRTSFDEHREAFRDWVFCCGDFGDLYLGPADFVYADPPYDVPFTQYSKGGFGWAEQVRAAEWLANHSGPVVLSNQATDRIVRLYDGLGYRLTYVDAPRRISCTGDRRAAPEVIATRNL